MECRKYIRRRWNLCKDKEDSETRIELISMNSLIANSEQCSGGQLGVDWLCGIFLIRKWYAIDRRRWRMSIWYNYGRVACQAWGNYYQLDHKHDDAMLEYQLFQCSPLLVMRLSPHSPSQKLSTVSFARSPGDQINYRLTQLIGLWFRWFWSTYFQFIR